MNEEQAKAVANFLGGQTWQSGGGIWLVIFERTDGKLAVISDDAICEYANQEDFDNCKPRQSILLRWGELKMYNKAIKTVEDVRVFFKYLVNIRSVNFHPDTDFSEYVSCDMGRKTFTDDEVAQYNTLMEACFRVCEEAGADIYEIGLEAFKRGKNSWEVLRTNSLKNIQKFYKFCDKLE
jgi:hypothetical protein